MKNKSFKFSDRFPVRVGDLCKMNEETNDHFREYYSQHDVGQEPYNHVLYGMTMVVLDSYIDKSGDKHFNVLVQETSEYNTVPEATVHRILIL